MALSNNLFYLLEFEDGIQVVPDTWMQKDDNKCWYPNYKKDCDITRAIKKRQSPQDNWLTYPIKRIFGTYRKYHKCS